MVNKPFWKHPVNVGVGFRVLINVASPSHEMATGEYTEHKKAPIYYNGRTYLEVPIISGNALRRYVKEALIVTAVKHGLKLGNLCRKGIFTHWNDKTDLQEDIGTGKELKSVEDVKDLLKECFMEDVSGFMYTEGKASIIRFSRLHVATMKPTYEALEHAKVYPIQLARHDPRRIGEAKSKQMVFRVEHISGEFAGLITLDAHLLGFDDYTQEYFVDNVPDDVISRAKAVVEAIYLALRRLGAMKSRSLTVGDVTSLVITIAEGLFTPVDPSRKDYIELTEKEAEAYKNLTGWEVSIVKYPGDVGSVGEAFNKSIKALENALKNAIEVKQL